ncbi:MAG: hypothetical protein H6867_01610 [Rhodospirillales bacterium]|nr:hypothetical protein [Rhodospirillales bacterium]MCB9997214.1 hypothetical protein [Rhodospirillales bacterium]
MNTMSSHNRSGESGGVIYWIFIAIALFAALNFVVSNIGRGGGTGMEELAHLRASEIIQYASAVQRGIRVMTIEGVDESELCFHAAQWGHNSYEFNPQCTDNTNRVFHPDGGSITFQDGVEEWYDVGASAPDAMDWVISARYEVTDAGTDSGGAATVAANADLIIATAPLSEAVCNAINSQLDFIPSTPPVVAAGTYLALSGNKYTGTFSNGAGRIGALGRQRCLAEDDGGGDVAFYFFYKVILAR